MRHTRHILQTIALALALFAAGQNAWATTKTVTYTITSVESSDLNYIIVFTRSGNVFESSAQTTYTATVSASYFAQATGGKGNFSVNLADGFQLSFSWGNGSIVVFQNNCIRASAEGKKMTYDISGKDTDYYVTHLTLTGMEGTWTNTDVAADRQWDFSESITSGFSLGSVILTYTDTPDIGIFESDGENAYKIKSKDDLRHLANYVNNGHNNCSGLTFRQTQNITCDNTYVPIGFYTSSDNAGFCGTYDGQGKTVSGITVTRTGGLTYANGYIGLFGYVLHSSTTAHGTVKNVILANSSFTGSYYIGGIVGYCTGTVQNCRVENTVTINSGTNAAASFGGIVGSLNGSRSNVIGCISAAALSRNGFSLASSFGGIVGNLNDEGTIKDCLYTGTSIDSSNSKGAVLGSLGSGTLSNNYYTNIDLGGVNGSDADGARRARTVTLDQNVTLVGNETVYDVSGLTAIGSGNYALRNGDTTYSRDGQVLTFTYTGAAPAEGYNIAIYVNGVLATDNGNGTFTATMPAADATVTVGSVVIPWSGSGDSADTPYLIQYPSQLNLLATNVNAGNDYEGKFFKLANDITYSPTTSWDSTELNDQANIFTAIGRVYNSTPYPFSGTFDGDGHAVIGIRITKKDTRYQGLFGFNQGTIKNLTLSNARIFSNKEYVGGIAGFNKGTITNCHVSDNVNVLGNGDCHGGIVGFNKGTITNCTSSVSLNWSGHFRGGIAGQTDYEGTVENCLVIGVSYNFDGYKNLGAILGKCSDESILHNNYYRDCSVNGATTNIGIGNVFNSFDNDGARSVHTLSLPAGVTATGNKTVTIGSTLYYASTSTVTLAFTGGMALDLVYNVNGTPIEGNSFEMPAADATVTVSTSVSYIDENGFEQICSNCTFLTSSSGDQTLGDSNNDEAWYVVSGEITIGGTLNFVDKAIHLILCDGASLSIISDNTYGIYFGGDSFIIYGQSGGSGAVSATGQLIGINAESITINGGTVNACSDQRCILANSGITINGGTIRAICGADGYSGIECHGENVIINGGSVTAIGGSGTETDTFGIFCHNGITVNGGTVTAAGRSDGIHSEWSFVRINGGTVTATSTHFGYGIFASVEIYLGWTHISDSITASSYNTNPTLYPHQAFIDTQDRVYTNNKLTSVQTSDIAGETLRPYLQPGSGQPFTLAQGTKDGVTAWWSTFYKTANYFLSEGAAAYTLGSDFKLYRLGTDGRTIPKQTAVVIIATEATIQTYNIGSSNMHVTDYAPGGNQLQGSSSAVQVSGISGTPYVLSIDSNGVIGFRQYIGNDDIPAGKAFYTQ